ncbi:hypothetical protein L7F22_059783 [Adiantum nelumboides]|nr:hypothetical protein [Adiantum nelumboides]
MPPKTRLSTVLYRHAEGQDRISLDVHEFISLANASKWIVVSDDPKSDRVFVCCPSLQPTMLNEGEHVRLIQESGSVKLKVDDMYDTKYASFKDGFLQEEAAFISMLNLLKQEKKGKKKKRQGQKIKETQVQPQESPQGTQEGTYLFTEGASSAAAGFTHPMEIIDTDAQIGIKQVQPQESPQETQVQPQESPQGTQEGTYLFTEGASSAAAGFTHPMEIIDTDAQIGIKQDGSIGVADIAGSLPTEIVDKTTEGYAKDVGKASAQPTDEVFFVDGKIIVQGKGKSSLEILADIWVQQKNFGNVLCSVQGDLKGVQDDLKGVQDDLKGVRDDLKILQKSVSQVAERGCRSNLALFYSDFVGNDVQLIQPIVTRWFPYNEVQMGKQDLERLALLYMREGEKVHKSGLVEVDMLLKVVVGGLQSQASPHCLESSQASARAPQREFTHLIIGEYSRSTMLCARASDYQHPLQPSRGSSAKLLYKLIQVERAATAATQYYGTGDHIIDAAAIMSPSFKRLSDPELLIRTILQHVNGELPIVERLFSRGKMWLLDL